MSFEKLPRKMDQFRPLAHSLQPLTRSSQGLTNASQKHAEKEAFATERARLLLGQFRRGEANDPGTFITAIAAVLARYPEAVVSDVTDPRTGLARNTDWLPTVREVVVACETLATREASHQKSNATREQTLARRAEEPVRAMRPTIEELREKYGPNWGLNRFKKERVEATQLRIERDQRAVRNAILAEYKRLGREPVYAGDLLISPGLVDQIHSEYPS